MDLGRGPALRPPLGRRPGPRRSRIIYLLVAGSGPHTEDELAYLEQKMRADWDRRARENARFYVATGRQQWTDEEFFASGEEEVRNHILTDMTNICRGKDPRRMAVLEIGCGAGRVTRALAKIFGTVYAVDISGEMVRQARRALAGYPNVRVEQNNGRDLRVLGKIRVDFAFSSIVFQHIPSKAIIEGYVREVHRLLRYGCLFKFQVQGDASIERTEDDTWLGVPFTDEEAVDMALRCGFDPRYRHGAGTQYFWLWYFKGWKPWRQSRYCWRRFSQYARMRWETSRRSS